ASPSVSKRVTSPRAAVTRVLGTPPGETPSCTIRPVTGSPPGRWSAPAPDCTRAGRRRGPPGPSRRTEERDLLGPRAPHADPADQLGQLGDDMLAPDRALAERDQEVTGLLPGARVRVHG